MISIDNSNLAWCAQKQETLLSLYQSILLCRQQAEADGGNAVVYWLDMAKLGLERQLGFPGDNSPNLIGH